jgi:hypothetical protein
VGGDPLGREFEECTCGVLGTKCLGDAGQHQEPRRDEEGADQFHCGLEAGTSAVVALTVKDEINELTFGTSDVRSAWLPRTT